jgi:glycosyltransferase involved in cell wall biosynthesis
MPPDRPRIAHVITGLLVGGAERMLVKLVAATADRFDHTVISLIGEGPLAADVRAAGADVIALDAPRGFLAALVLGRLRRTIAALDPDLVQGWMYGGNVFASAAAGRRPVLWNIRHTLARLRDETPATQATLLISHLMGRHPAAILYNSFAGAQRHEAFGYPRERRVLLPNGFDTTRFRPDPAARAASRKALRIGDDRVVIGRVARNHPMKDNVTLLEAFRIIHVARPDARLVLVGDGMTPDDPGLGELIATRGLADAVLLLGRRGDLETLIPAFDLAILSSQRGEAFPNVIGEAMAAGVPVVATDVGDCAGIIGDPSLVVPPRDCAALAGAALSVLSRPAVERAALGARLRARIEAEYRLETIGDRYAEIWRRHARPRPARRGASA